MPHLAPLKPISGVPPRRWLGECALVAAAYALTGHAGLALAHAHASATLVWPPSGIAVATLLLVGPRGACGVLLGAFAVNVWNGTPALAAAGIALGNTAEAIVALFLLRRAGFEPRLGRMRDVLALVGLGALGATTVAALGGTLSLASAGLLAGHAPAEVALVWWLGDAAGVLVFAPVLLVAARGAPSWPEVLRPELAVAALGIVVTSSIAFGAPIAPWLALLFALAGSPLVVWAGLRGGARGAVIASLLAVVPAMFATTAGHGPLAGPDRLASVALLLAYCTSLGATALVLAAAIHERDAAEEARARAQAENERLLGVVARTERLQAIGLLAGGVAHDFNNLLAVIQTNTSVARTAVGEASLAREALDDVLEASARAAEICGQLLGVGGRLTLRPVRFDLRAAAEETVALARRTAPDSVVLEVEPGPPVELAGDRGRITQVLMNLVQNAVEAIGTRRGGAVRVRVTADAPPPDAEPGWTGDVDELADKSLVALEVEDEGCGMDEATQKRLFEPFFTTKSGGRGLGTAGVLGAVRAHGGAIQVRTTPGKGTLFRVVVPRGDVAAAAAPSVTPSARAPRAGTLLLADDEGALRRTVGRALERAGWTVHEASDGAEALALFEADPSAFDAVVLDVRMPRLTGPEALARMWTLRRDLPAVLVTGYASETDLPSGDATRIVAKPFVLADLLGAIEAEIAAHAKR